MKKNNRNTVETQVQYRLIEELTAINAKLKDEIKTRKESQRPLNLSEKKYRLIIEEASDLIYQMDKDGNLTFVNQSTLNIIGLREEDLIGKHYSILIRKDFRNKALTFYKQVFAKQTNLTHFEFPLNIKKELWIGQNITIQSVNGKVKNIQAVGRNITDRVIF
ncbi:MAG: PAS domain S-box protein, partial [Flavobacteriales bacterium]|nr:PAS domain S-box protein [Flavobacteriales bacterium]